MYAYPGFDRRMMRALLWLSALAALSLFGAPRARAADATTQTSTPTVTPPKEETAQPTVSPAPTTSATEGSVAPTASSKATKSSSKSKKSKSANRTVRPKISSAAVSEAITSTPGASSASSDSAMTLRGGQDRTDFRTLTVEGEDRVHVEVERPTLTLDLDPDKVSGLESGTAGDVLNRVAPDLTTSYLASSTDQPMPYLARPWLSQFATGSVARFEPNVKSVERWKLMVADSKGQVVKTYEGKGDPPKEMRWDGRSQNGNPVTPGLTYSYIFEAYDKAGNKRNFVGQGFRVSAYRLDSPTSPVLVFSGQSLLAAQRSGASFGMGGATGSKATPAIILEAASWINQSERVSQPVRVTATARSYEQANLLSKVVGSSLNQLLLGDPARIQTVGEVVPDAPDGGMIRIALGPVGPAGSAPGSPLPSTPVKSDASKDAKKSNEQKHKK
jgi:hypothetical protein